MLSLILQTHFTSWELKLSSQFFITASPSLFGNWGSTCCLLMYEQAVTSSHVLHCTCYHVSWSLKWHLADIKKLGISLVGMPNLFLDHHPLCLSPLPVSFDNMCPQDIVAFFSFLLKCCKQTNWNENPAMGSIMLCTFTLHGKQICIISSLFSSSVFSH